MNPAKQLLWMILILCTVEIHAQEIIEEGTTKKQPTPTEFSGWLGAGIQSPHYFGSAPFGIAGGVEARHGKFAGGLFISRSAVDEPQHIDVPGYPRFYYYDSELDWRFELLVKYNFLRATSRSVLDIISGIGLSHTEFSYVNEIDADPRIFLSVNRENRISNLVSIPVGLSYDFRLSDKWAIGAMTIFHNSLNFETILRNQETRPGSGVDGSKQTLGTPLSASALLFLRYFL